ncbi:MULTISPECIES: FadR/GntR family transcriptional regulator [Pseudomonas]|jgi:DNA-binding FadR family transcriptional regulator|uniref:FadR/GntR family transcriptional regulator n=1 Tax=Pseudomonas TaxID=286 RepID=UPI00076137D8|nr:MULTISPECIES: FadR/GntR family transcriptional regulator [Pseudomonas]QXI32956.1 FadR family transcriptional regulator [Pseudomonas promysalinigenes]
MSHELAKRSLVELAVERMRERILQGHWQVGQRLPTEPVLALEMGISRNTVREAMRVLAFSGLVEVRQGDGSYLRTCQDPLQAVQAMSRCTFEQARETRHILEVEAIGLAALRRTDEDLRALRAALAGSAEHFHGDIDAYVSCDLVFHQRLIDAAHNPALSELYRYFSGVVAAALQHNMATVPRCQATFDLHGQILDAIEQRDPERAKALSRTLIES